jgi:hypothetical protein
MVNKTLIPGNILSLNRHYAALEDAIYSGSLDYTCDNYTTCSNSAAITEINVEEIKKWEKEICEEKRKNASCCYLGWLDFCELQHHLTQDPRKANKGLSDMWLDNFVKQVNRPRLIAFEHQPNYPKMDGAYCEIIKR